MALFFNKRHNDIPKNKRVQDLPLDKLVPNRYQPRKQFTDESIEELAQTLERDGLLQPIVVREDGDNYEIVAGERRLRAAKLLGWTKIPAIVQDLDDQQAASLALIENLQRENLNPIDEAKAYQKLMDLQAITQADLAHRIGKSQSFVANKLRLLKLTPKVQEYLANGKITSRHGRALLKLGSDQQEKAIDEILAEDLNVKETEAMVENFDEYFAKKKKKIAQKRVIAKTSGDLKVQINTIRQAIKLAKDSGIKVKFQEDSTPEEYKVTIELHRK